jgi:hypothetical protein
MQLHKKWVGVYNNGKTKATRKLKHKFEGENVNE